MIKKGLQAFFLEVCKNKFFQDTIIRPTFNSFQVHLLIRGSRRFLDCLVFYYK